MSIVHRLSLERALGPQVSNIAAIADAIDGMIADGLVSVGGIANSFARNTVFVGGVAAGFGLLKQPEVAAEFLACGNVGLYQHGNGIASLGPGGRGQLWQTWARAGVTPSGQGETVGEVGAFTPVPAGYLAYFGGRYPPQVNMNILTNSGNGTSTYLSPAGEKYPGTTYLGYTSAADLVAMKSAIDAAVAVGAQNVAIFMTPNGGGEDYDNAFATSGYWANVRLAALYGGGIALDVPPSYWLARGGGYQSIITQMILWCQQQGIRSSLTISPYTTVLDASGNTSGCGYDTMFLSMTQRLVDRLKAAGAMPSQWVIENYCITGTENDFAAGGGPGTLNEIALYIARSVKVSQPGDRPAQATGIAASVQMPTVRPGPLRISDIAGAGTMASQDGSAVAITGGIVGGSTAITTTATPLFLGGVLVQGTATAAFIDGNTPDAITFSRPDGSPLSLRLPAGDLQPQTIGARDGARPAVIATHALDVDGALLFNGTRFVISSGLPTSDPHILGVLYEDSAGRLYRSHGP